MAALWRYMDYDLLLDLLQLHFWTQTLSWTSHAKVLVRTWTYNTEAWSQKKKIYLRFFALCAVSKSGSFGIVTLHLWYIKFVSIEPTCENRQQLFYHLWILIIQCVYLNNHNSNYWTGSSKMTNLFWQFVGERSLVFKLSNLVREVKDC